jgi:hypothetical protein
MARFETFERDLRLATKGLPEEISKELAKFARRELRRVISAGQASENYQKFVNGREGAAEETVKAPGPILYIFSNWKPVIEAALQELRNRSPRRSGQYRSGFVVTVGGRTVVTNFENIDADAEIVIFNRLPYTRKIEVGTMKKMSVPAHHFNAARAAVSSRFSRAFKIEHRFVSIPGGVVAGAPYIDREGKGIGKPLSYPALVINQL